jgi:hypothetical protein
MISGSGILVESIVPFTRDQGGRLRLYCAKDRHGVYRRREIMGDLELFVRADGHLGWKLHQPDEPGHVGIERLNQMCHEAISTVRRLTEEGFGNEFSLNRIEAAMTVRGAHALKRQGVELAVERGFLREIMGANRARLFALVNELEDEGNT